MIRWALAPLLAVVCGTGAAHAQIGRFALLAPVAGAEGHCHATSVQSATSGEGANRIITLQLDGEPQRVLAVTTNARGGVLTFTTRMSARVGTDRREVESITAHFDANGQVTSGSHHYSSTSTTSALTDDRQQALTADDAAGSLVLAKKVIERCGR